MVKLPALRGPEVSHRTPRTLGVHVGKSDQGGSLSGLLLPQQEVNTAMGGPNRCLLTSHQDTAVPAKLQEREDGRGRTGVGRWWAKWQDRQHGETRKDQPHPV